MARYITAVRMSGGNQHRHIAGCAILYDGAKPYKAYTKTVAGVIEAIDGGTRYITRDWQGNIARVAVVDEDDGTRYIRTIADGVYGDNLLRLPRYVG
jgi:hypothetical protein